MAAVAIKPTTQIEKKTRTVVDTILVTPEKVRSWKSPSFQRELRENRKVLALAEQLKTDGGVWPGIVTLGVLDGQTYLIDGQHRAHAFVMSGVHEGYTDVRIHYFNTLAEMGDEFVKLNSQLAVLRPDDILRGLESAMPVLRRIREACPFIGYYVVRNQPHAPILSMSMVLRAWRCGVNDIPAPGGGSDSGRTIAAGMDEAETRFFVDFMNIAYAAFGRDVEYMRLWSRLNLVLCVWMYKHVVLSQYSPKTPRLTKELFQRCLMALSADAGYLDWLVGRNLSERDRSPAYSRMKAIFARRIMQETGKKVSLPAPPWAHDSGSRLHLPLV
jgi:hypothetical protein